MIKLKKLLKEGSPGFIKREFGDPLPTFKEVMEKHKVNITEADDGMKYDVVLKGGSIGERRISGLSQLKGKTPLRPSSKLYDTYERAVKARKFMNSDLSVGEKKYYGLLYIIAGVKDGKYTGKGR
tara:strand:+ start:204 stop:578 length:375 start_codon:yes stop_codon:yes gene_type:complete